MTASPPHAPAAEPAARTRRLIAYALIVVVPALFAVNQLGARHAADQVPPHFLALGRWSGAFLLLLPFVGRELWRGRHAIVREWRDLVLLGALGMWICGAWVYIGGRTTTATNIGLIYAMAPVVVVVLSGLWLEEKLAKSAALGVALCVGGALLIVARGDLGSLLALKFVVGDLWIAAAATSWGVYSLLLRHRKSALGGAARLAAIIAGGVLVLIPWTIWEAAAVRAPTLDAYTIGAVIVLAVIPGVGAYGAHTFMTRELGVARTSVSLYLGPLETGLLAWWLLGEAPQWFHLAGAALILPGVWLSTRPAPK